MRVGDRDNWPDGTLAAFDSGVPIMRIDGDWFGCASERPLAYLPVGAYVLRVGHYADGRDDIQPEAVAG